MEHSEASEGLGSSSGCGGSSLRALECFVCCRLFAAKTVFFVVMMVVNRPLGLLRPDLFSLSKKNMPN
jgi:hypothetical protein